VKKVASSFLAVDFLAFKTFDLVPKSVRTTLAVEQKFLKPKILFLELLI